MVNQWKEIYSTTFQSGAINSTLSENYFDDAASLRTKDRYGSANSLIITSLAAEDFEVRLDGLDSRLIGILFTRGSFIIKPEDGIFFSSVRITNVSGTNSSANEVSIKISRAEAV